VRASRRAAITCAVAVLAATVTACSAATSSVTVNGNRLTIYASAPQQTADPRTSSDILDAEQLALSQVSSQVGKFAVRLVTLTGRISDNARQAIRDSTAIAYLGEVMPPDSGDSLGITNALDLLQVSPTDTALELTQATDAVPGSPNRYYESLSTYGRTFARVVPTTALEAKAQLQEMQSVGVRRLYVTDDGDPYGSAIALAVKQDAPADSITAVQGPADLSGFTGSGADALFVGASSDSVAAQLVRNVATRDPSVKVFVPSALDSPSFASALGSARVNLYASSPGFLPKDMTAAGQTFVRDFTAAYHHAPSVQAIFGYEAMAAVLNVLQEAGSSANNRSTVVRDFFALKNRDSVLGTYSIDANGDISLAPFVFSRLHGDALAPYKFVSVQG
jgi:branched-chain amino acid transport system substrate-binding protein